MKRKLLTSIIVVTLGLVASCTEQEFSSIPSDTCVNLNNAHGDGSCVQDEVTGLNTLSYQVDSCKADILFVVDNSGSMYEDQVELGKRFPDFLAAINKLDYNIAITTTDISISPNNYDPNNPELITRQDGRLIKFPNGKKFIKKDTANAQNEFEQTVRREETLNCDNGNKSACPSSDERGIYAVNYAITQAKIRGNFGETRFFRPDSHLAIVFLSDENVRSDAGQSLKSSSSIYQPTYEDTPQSIIDYIDKEFGQTKTFSAHPIVIQSKLTYADANGNLLGVDDIACHNLQASQQATRQDMIRYGTWYEQLAMAQLGTVDRSTISRLGGLVPGHAGSICAGNYTPVLSRIGASIAKNSQVAELACEPIDLKVSIGANLLSEGDYSLNGRKLQLPPTCEGVKVTYKCPRTI